MNDFETRPAAFLDRDGTIIHDGAYIADPAKVVLLPGAASAIARLNAAGIPAIVVTNQSGIARGLLTEEQYQAVHRRMLELLTREGARIDAAYHCPHHPDFGSACECRKPGTLLYRRAANEHGLALGRSFYVGDRWRDVAPAIALGGTGILVPSPVSDPAEIERARRLATTAPSLGDAVDRMIARSEEGEPDHRSIAPGHRPVPARIAVVASGGGTNLQAILDHFDTLGDARAGDVVLVASDRPDAFALSRARARGIPAVELAGRARPEGQPLDAALAEHEIDLVVLAGYLRLVPATVVRKYDGRILNVHPALLPAFGGPGMYGLRVHQAVLDAGATVSGATVHLVNEEFDRGAIVAQWPVPVLAGDDAHALARRVLRVEHALLPRVVQLAAAGRLTAERRPAAGALTPDPDLAYTLHDLDDAGLAREIDRALVAAIAGER